MRRASCLTFGVLLAASAALVAQAPVKHIGLTTLDTYLLCARDVLGKPVFRDPASLRRLPALGCPTSRVEFLADLNGRQETLVETDAWAFVYPTGFLKSPGGPTRPPIAWKRLILSAEPRNWTGIPDTRAMTSPELEMVGRAVLRDTRLAPVFTHDEPDADGAVNADYELRSTAARLHTTQTESIITIAGRPGVTGRLVYGELRDGQYQVQWDSPLFNALRLAIGFEDVDGDGVKEILVESWYDTSIPIHTMLTIFDLKGRELTRQPYCEFDITWGYDDSGVVCPVVGEAGITVADPRNGTRDLLVVQPDALEHPVRHRYSLRGGTYVDMGEVPDAAAAQQGDPVPALVRNLGSTDKYVRELAAQRLAEIGPAAKPAMPALIVALKDTDDNVCSWAVRALCSIGPDAASAVPAMMRMSTTGGGYLDRQCWGVPDIEIGKIGAPAVPYAIAAFGTADQESAVYLLMSMGPVAVPALSRVLNEGGPRALAAATVFERMGIGRDPAVVAAVPALRRAYEGGQIPFAIFASTIGAIGPAAKDAAPAVVTGLRSRDPALGRDAIAALELIGSASPVVIPALVDASKDPDPAIREAAARALQHIRTGQLPNGDPK